MVKPVKGPGLHCRNGENEQGEKGLPGPALLSLTSHSTAVSLPSKCGGDCGFNLLHSFVQSLYKKVSPQLFLLGKAQVEHISISDTHP